ncbi:MAG: hypothetical protein AVDCRST_MAG96-1883 [uncultured Segetibacter sp.]|uniref:Uncharacterized protein n=1 Tax=uncultured Segetibacter sp. TaxID=481133 RepID=A0A6J4SHN0_9BACT|nr:MAG: hypothetical protein AVDCRST_MAG96-1883 [uncultured Segetibacter sp.]
MIKHSPSTKSCFYIKQLFWFAVSHSINTFFCLMIVEFLAQCKRLDAGRRAILYLLKWSTEIISLLQTGQLIFV